MQYKRKLQVFVEKKQINHLLYFLLYLTALTWAFFYILQVDKVALHIKINSLVGNPALDTFFKYFTHLGDGIFAVILAIFVFLFNKRNGVFILSTYIVSGLFTSLLKNFFYSFKTPVK